MGLRLRLCLHQPVLSAGSGFPPLSYRSRPEESPDLRCAVCHHIHTGEGWCAEGVHTGGLSRQHLDIHRQQDRDFGRARKKQRYREPSDSLIRDRRGRHGSRGGDRRGGDGERRSQIRDL